MTERLYYRNSFLYEFEAQILSVLPPSPAEARTAVILERTAFYPTSGGQVFDTGWLKPVNAACGEKPSAVVEVAEREDGAILHFLDQTDSIIPGQRVHGRIDVPRRRDHMQQHSGQHLLSAAFIRLFNFATLSFHMGEEYCSIDLDTRSLALQQIEAAERLANEVVLENRPVEIRFVSQEEARGLGLRKLPAMDKDELRLVEIQEFDLTACGGTHVRRTGEIGSILLRKAEKVRQGTRVEFVCGLRAVSTARRDFAALSKAAALLSAHPWDVPQQVQKSQEEARFARKTGEGLLDELAEQYALRLLAGAKAVEGRKLITRVFADRDLMFIKLLAQKLTRLEANVVALLAVSQPASLVFAQSAGLPFNMSTLMQEALSRLGGRGGGSKDLAQGGPENSREMEGVLVAMADKLSTDK